MTVKELIDNLKKVDPERVVILQRDAEGNGYSPLCGIDDNAKYLEKTTWSGDIYPEVLSQDDLDAGWHEEDIPVKAIPAVVLFPIN